MEKIVFIKKVLPLQERQYTDRNGQQQTFVSRGFVLDDGIDCFYAEAVGDYARNLTQSQLNAEVLHGVSVTINARSFNDKNGVERFDNEIRINKIS